MYLYDTAGSRHPKMYLFTRGGLINRRKLFSDDFYAFAEINDDDKIKTNITINA